jgi:hypothetical protein
MFRPIASRTIAALAVAGGLWTFAAAAVQAAEDSPAVLREAENHFSEVDSDGLGLAYVLIVAETRADGRIHTESLDVLSDNNSAVARYLSPARLRGDLLLKRGATFRVRMRDDNRLTHTVHHRHLSKYLGFRLLPLITTDLTREYGLASVAEETVDGRPALRFSLQERKMATIYERVDIWVDKETHRPLRATFQEQDTGEIYELEYHYDDKTAEFAPGRRFVSRIECRIRGTERRIRLEFQDMRRIPDSVIYAQMLEVH